MEMSRRAAALSKRGAAMTGAAPAAQPVSQARPAASIAEASRPPRVATVAATNGGAALSPQAAGFVGERITVDCSDGPTRGKAAVAIVLILAVVAATGIFLL